MFTTKTPDEFKLILDKINDYQEIIPIFESLDNKQLYAFFTQLSDASWKRTTVEEWRSYIVFLNSQGFKSIVDYMSTEEIQLVWSFFDDWMTQKFFDGLTIEDIYKFTPAEWEASLEGFSSSEFKKMFFDRMDFKGIMHVVNQLGDMDDFLEGLTLDDWVQMTTPEWEVFLFESEIEDLVEFIHFMHGQNSKIVYKMFANMPEDIFEAFKQAPELAHEFSNEELQTMKKGAEANPHRKDSLFDEEFVIEREEEEHEMYKRRRGGHQKKGKNGKGGRKHDRKDHTKKGERKHDREDRRERGERKHDREGERKHDREDRPHKGEREHDRKDRRERDERRHERDERRNKREGRMHERKEQEKREKRHERPRHPFRKSQEDV